MSDDIKVNITATDNASVVFTKVGKQATTMGEAIENAGKEGAQGFKLASDGAEKFGKSLNTFQQESESAASNLQQLGDFLGNFSDLAVENQRLTDGLSRAYGDAGDDMLAFADHLQDTTNFSNEAAQAALLLANSLVSNYGLAADQVQQLASVSADLAQIYGLALADAMQRTSAALRGEGEAAEALGLNMSDAAIAAKALEAGIANWSVPGALTEAEKAAFRYSVLMEQAAFATGAAADAAGGARGTITELGDRLQDVATSASDALGPLPAVGEALANVASEAFTVIGGGAAIINTFRSVGQSAVAARVGTAALSLAFNPLTAVIGGAVAVGAALFKSWMDQKQAAQEYELALGDLGDTIEVLRRRGDTDLANMVDEQKTSIDGLKTAIEGLNEETSGIEFPDTADYKDDAEGYGIALGKAEEALEAMRQKSELAGPALAKLNEAMSDPNIDADAYLAWINNLVDTAAATADVADDIAALELINQTPLSNFSKHTGDVASQLDTDAASIKASLEDIGSVIEGVGKQALELELEGFEQEAKDVQTLADAFLQLQKPTRELVPVFDELTGAIEYQTKYLNLSEDGLEKASLAYDKLNEALASGDYDNARLLADYMQAIADAETPDEAAAATFELTKNLADYELKVSAATLGASAFNTVLAAGASALDAYAAAVSTVNGQMIDWLGNGDNILGFLRDFTADTGALGESLGDGKVIVNDFGQSFMIARNIDEAAAALDSFLGYYDMIDSLGQRSSKSGAIADYLFGPDGNPYDSIGPLRELYDAQIIGETQFQEAVRAGISIQESNLKVQEDLNKIRVDQLPLLEEQQLAYEKQIDALAKLSPEQQQYALAMQDSGYQTQLSSLYATAYSASLGEIPKEVATNMIVSAAEADPVLAGLLEKFGLIEEVVGPDGTVTYKVNLPDAESTTESINNLTDSIVTLTDLLDDGEINGSVNVEVDRSELDATLTEFDNYQNDPWSIPAEVTIVGGPGHDSGHPLADFDDVTITATLDDQATEGMDEVERTAGALDGTEATVLVLADINDAMSSLADIERQHQNLDGDRVTMLVLGDTRDAMGEFREVERRHDGLDGQRSTMVVLGDISDAQGDINWAKSFDGDILARSYIDIVTRQYTAGGPGHRDGGIIGMANGGIVPVELAEDNPEILHFADGGMIPVFERGIYGVQAGTYVSPAPASASAIAGMGNVTVNLHFHAPVYGLEDFEDQLMRRTAEAMESAIMTRRAALGGS